MESIKKILRPIYVPMHNWYEEHINGLTRYKNLYKQIRAVKAKRIMEVGTWNGDRAMEMIATAAQFHPVTEVEYYGFDLFEEMNQATFEEEISKIPPSVGEVRAKLEETGANTTLFKGNTMTSLPAAVENLPKMDFIYIDGGHSKETVANDWKYSEMLMHENTIVVFDDYWVNRTDECCKELVDSLDRNKYDVSLSKEVDRHNNKDFGRLEIRYAFVKKASQRN